LETPKQVDEENDDPAQKQYFPQSILKLKTEVGFGTIFITLLAVLSFQQIAINM
jgi:hypothetical protein